MEKIKKTEAEWWEFLSNEAYFVTREKGTEKPFTGKYDRFNEEGIYRCICCSTKLFDSKDKFDSGCGWPSFKKPKAQSALKEKPDDSLPGHLRTEVICYCCDAHLGHVFEDGSVLHIGLRYCINSAALKFEKNTKSGSKLG